jgi:hypothetical protein
VRPSASGGAQAVGRDAGERLRAEIGGQRFVPQGLMQRPEGGVGAQCRHLLFVTSKYHRRIPVYFSFNKLAFTSLSDVTILSQNFGGETQLDSCSCNKTNKAS